MLPGWDMLQKGCEQWYQVVAEITGPGEVPSFDYCLIREDDDEDDDGDDEKMSYKYILSII